ncbi:MAG: hypothetical protein WCP25_10745 [Polynucleobacter sp.]
MQFPIPTSVTSPVVVVVQMAAVELVNEMARPLEAVAVICTGDWLNVTPAGRPNVITFGALLTAIVLGTATAALQNVAPDCPPA